MTLPTTAQHDALERILERVDLIARCSEHDDRITRRFGTPALLEAQQLTENWMREAGLETTRDPILNIVGRRPRDGGADDTSSPPPVLRLGSHLDSVPDAGRFDGVLGVLLAIATVEVLRSQRAQLPFDLEVLAFSEEEGTRFATSYLGSRTFCGQLSPETLERTDDNGLRLGDLLETLPHRGQPARPLDQPCLGYLEAHIEQGPVLERSEAPLAVVTGIVAQSRTVPA